MDLGEIYRADKYVFKEGLQCFSLKVKKCNQLINQVSSHLLKITGPNDESGQFILRLAVYKRKAIS